MPTFPAVPVPPMDLSAPQSLSVVFTVICVAIFILAVAYGLLRAARKDWMAMACLIGGLFAGLLEPMLDNLGLLWFAQDNAYIAVTTFHRFVPLYVVLGYSFFFGGQAYLAYRAASTGRSRTWFWGLYLFAWVFDFALQAGGAAFGLYKYYGPQPFLILGTPAWWFSIDAALPALAALVFLGLRKQMSASSHLLLAIPLVPALYAGLNAAAGWPVFSGINSSSSTIVVWACGSVTIALALLVQWIAVNAIYAMQNEESAEMRVGETDCVAN